MMRVSTRPITARRFCSKQPRRTKRSIFRAIGGPFNGLYLSVGAGVETLPMIARGHAGRYVKGLWIKA